MNWWESENLVDPVEVKPEEDITIEVEDFKIGPELPVLDRTRNFLHHSGGGGSFLEQDGHYFTVAGKYKFPVKE